MQIINIMQWFPHVYPSWEPSSHTESHVMHRKEKRRTLWAFLSARGHEVLSGTQYSKGALGQTCVWKKCPLVLWWEEGHCREMSLGWIKAADKAGSEMKNDAGLHFFQGKITGPRCQHLIDLHRCVLNPLNYRSEWVFTCVLCLGWNFICFLFISIALQATALLRWLNLLYNQMLHFYKAQNV